MTWGAGHLAWQVCGVAVGATLAAVLSWMAEPALWEAAPSIALPVAAILGIVGAVLGLCAGTAAALAWETRRDGGSR